MDKFEVETEDTIISHSYHTHSHQLPAPPPQGNLSPPLVSSVTVGPPKTNYYSQYGGGAQSVGAALYMTSPTAALPNEFYMASDGKFYRK